MSEEVHPARVTYSWADPQLRPFLLIVQHGRCIAESTSPSSPARDPLLLLSHASANVCALEPAESFRLTVSHAPCRLLRLVLPVASSLTQTGRWNVDLALLLPMLRLFEQSLHHPGGQARRGELGSTLFAYLRHSLSDAGCNFEPAISLDRSASSASIEDDLLSRLTLWLRDKLSDSLRLEQLAEAVSISPRRLQEICRQERGCTPMELLRSLRLECFANYLLDPSRKDESIGFLTRLSGLPESSATRRDFFRRFGQYPHEYRTASLLTNKDPSPAPP